MRLTAAAERLVRAGHPWVYALGIAKGERDHRAGGLAVLYDRRDRFLAVGLYDSASPIRVRVLQRFTQAPIDRAWFAAKITTALRRRAPLLRDRDTTGYRLVHGENEGLPGLVVDRYADTLVVKLYTAAWAAHLDDALAALRDLVPASRVVLRLSRAVARAGGEWRDGQVLAGLPLRGPVQFLEHGLRFEADVARGNKTGFFLDQRENRAQVETLSRGRRVLDVFASSGAFSLHAARGGARAVACVEQNRAAVPAIARHFALNRASPSVARVQPEVLIGDGFEALASLGRAKRRFDLVILDPPAFAQRRDEVPRALAAYRQLTLLALAVLETDGILVSSCCAGQVRAERFFHAVQQAAASTRRRLAILARTGHPPDHPIGFPEGAYLKCLFARVISPPRPKTVRPSSHREEGRRVSR